MKASIRSRSASTSGLGLKSTPETYSTKALASAAEVMGMDAYSGEARRVLVVDDSEVVRDARCALLLEDDRDLELVGEAADGESGVAMAASCAPTSS